MQPALEDYRQTQGAVWDDFDNDGWQDLYVANFDTPDELYRNIDGTSFFWDSDTIMATLGEGHGATWCDVDGDGLLDLLVPRWNQPNRLLRNSATNGNQRLSVELVGVQSNRDVYGAEVRVFTPDLTQLRHVESTIGFAGQAPA